MNYFSCCVIGSGELAIACSKTILQKGHTIAAILCQDAFLLRWANENAIKTFLDISELELYEKEFDFLFSIQNNIILPPRCMALPKKMVINYHNSLLPKYAGMNATSWAILHREKVHGITWHQLTEQIDGGDIVFQKEFPIYQDDTALSLNMRCAAWGEKTFHQVVDRLAQQSSLSLTPQDLRKRSYYKESNKPKGVGFLKWEDDAFSIDHLLRTCEYGQYTNTFCSVKIFCNQRVFLIKEARVENKETMNSPPGMVIYADSQQVCVALNKGLIYIKKVSTVFDKEISINTFIQNNNLKKGVFLKTPSQFFVARFQNNFEKLSSFERFWVKELKNVNIEHVNFPLPVKSKQSSDKSIISKKLDFSDKLFCQKDNWNNEEFILTIIFLYLIKTNYRSSFTVNYSNNKLLNFSEKNNLLFSSILPFSLGLDSSCSCIHFYEKVKQKHFLLRNSLSFVSDLFFRYQNEITYFNSPVSIAIVEDFSDLDLGENELIKFFILKDYPFVEVLARSQSVCDSASYTLDSLEKHLTCLVARVLNNPKCLISDISLATTEEYKTLLNHWSNKDSLIKINENLGERFSRVANQALNKKAIVSNTQSVSYKELLNQVENCASTLLKIYHVQPEDVIGVCSSERLDFVIIILAVLKAGATYCPLDVTMPLDRLAHIIKDSSPSLIISPHGFEPQLEEITDKQVVNFETIFSYETEVSYDHFPAVSPNAAAYIMYTSGSTGTPKGVVVPHKAVIRLVIDQSYFSIDDEDVVLFNSNLSFDASTFEIWAALLNSGILYYEENSPIFDPCRIQNIIQNTSVNIIWLTAGLFDRCVEYNEGMFSSLKFLLVGGDVLNRENVLKVISNNNKPRHFSNCYGPTENTTFSTTYEINTYTQQYLSIPIGRPINNTLALVLDQDKQIIPIGLFGELYVGGEGLATGYLNRSQETRERFAYLPYFSGQRFYKTGDVVRWLPNQELEFLGRKDAQVKIRGFRIEIKEIENHIKTYPAVNESVVLTKQDAHDRYLIAYITVQGAKISFDIGQLKTFLRQKLPEYMVPSVFVVLDALPLTINGKVDRNTLEKYASDASVDVPNSKELAENALEERLIDIWQSILPNKNVRPDSDFFGLGGHSLLVTVVLKKMEEHLNVSIPAQVFLRKPTIRHIANYLLDKQLDDEVETQILQDSKLDPKIIGQSVSKLPYNKNIKVAFITGVTGFLGGHLLRTFLTRTSCKVFCLIRANTFHEAEEKLKESLSDFDLSDHYHRIIILLGNLAQERLGLSTGSWEQLAQEADVLYHCGAQVNHVKNYIHLRESNALSVLQLIRLATTKKLKSIEFVSTLTAAFDRDTNGFLLEKQVSSNLKDIFSSNGYSQSKWVAEHLLWQANKKGVPIRIYRPAWIIGSTNSYQMPIKDNHLFLFIKGCLALGAFPNMDNTLQWIPVNHVAELIFKISFSKTNKRFFNLVSLDGLKWTDAFNVLREKDYPFNILEFQQWSDWLYQKAGEANPLRPLMSLYESETYLESLKGLDQVHNENVVDFLKKDEKLLSLNQSMLRNQITFFLKNF